MGTIHCYVSHRHRAQDTLASARLHGPCHAQLSRLPPAFRQGCGRHL